MHEALTNLRASIQSVREITADVDAHAAAALRHSEVMARHQTVLCAATVILSGFLESFIKEVAREMIGEVCSRAITFNDLPAKIRMTHYEEGGRWIQKMAQSEKQENPLTHRKTADAARRLASVQGGGSSYEILWEAFIDTQANPGPSQIRDFLKRFGVDDPLKKLAQSVNATQNTLSMRLSSFIEVRNECAHTGSCRNIPTTTDVQGYCDLLEQVGEGVVKVFQARLQMPPYTAATESLSRVSP